MNGTGKDSFIVGSNIPTFDSVMKSIEADAERYRDGMDEEKAIGNDVIDSIWVPPALDFTAPVLQYSSNIDLELSNMSFEMEVPTNNDLVCASVDPMVQSPYNELSISTPVDFLPNTTGRQSSPGFDLSYQQKKPGDDITHEKKNESSTGKRLPKLTNDDNTVSSRSSISFASSKEKGSKKAQVKRKQTKMSEQEFLRDAVSKSTSSNSSLSKGEESRTFMKKEKHDNESRSDASVSTHAKAGIRREIDEAKSKPVENTSVRKDKTAFREIKHSTVPDNSIATMLSQPTISSEANALLNPHVEPANHSESLGSVVDVDGQGSEMNRISTLLGKTRSDSYQQNATQDGTIDDFAHDSLHLLPEETPCIEANEHSFLGQGMLAAYERLRSWDEAPEYVKGPERVIDEIKETTRQVRKSGSSWAVPMREWSPFSHIRRVAPNDHPSELRPDPPDETSSVRTGESLFHKDQRVAWESRTTSFFYTHDDVSVTSNWAPPSNWISSGMKRLEYRQAPTSEIDLLSRSSTSLSNWAPPGQESAPPKPDQAALFAAWHRPIPAQSLLSPSAGKSMSISSSKHSQKENRAKTRKNFSPPSSPLVPIVTTQPIPEYLDKPSIFEQMEEGKISVPPLVFKSAASPSEKASLLTGLVKVPGSDAEESRRSGVSDRTSQSDHSVSSESDKMDVEHGTAYHLPDFPPAAEKKVGFVHEIKVNSTLNQDMLRPAEPECSMATSSKSAGNEEEVSEDYCQNQSAGLDHFPLQDDIEEGKKDRHWQFCCKIFFLLLLLGGGAAAATFMLVGGDDEPASVPTSPPTDGIESMIWIALDAVGGSDPLNDPNSAQSQALAWLNGNENLEAYSSARILQRFVMASLFYSTVGTQWNKDDGWMTDEDECKWHSSETENPVCDGSGSLDLMDLDSNNVAGTIVWADFATLANELTVVDFHNNSVSGSLPTQIGLLTNLVTLDVSANQVTGTLPPEIGRLNRLVYMDFGNNFLSGTLPSTLAGMIGLETLQLNDNDITGKIPTEIGLMSNLERLDLRNTFVTGTMPQEVCNLPALREIEAPCGATFSCDCCKNPECDTTSNDPISEMIAARSPDGGQSLTDPNSPQSLALEWLKSPLNSDFVEEERLIQRYVLATLFYSTAGEGWNSDFMWLTSSDECIWFTTSKSSTICDQDGRLLELDIRENKLFGSLPPELVMLSDSLQILRLSQNSLGGTIPTILHELSMLEHLDLSANALGGSLPTELGLFGAALTHLTVFDNAIGSTIPPELAQLSGLQVLDLGSNSLTGTIPTQIALIRNLAGLSFFDNRLTGSVPCELRALDRLELLYLDSNDLGPSICDDICVLELLEFWSDCSEVQCTCCTTCCDDEFGCVS